MSGFEPSRRRWRPRLSVSAGIALAISLLFVAYYEWSAWQWLQVGPYSARQMGEGWLLRHREGEPLTLCIIDMLIAALVVASVGWLVERRARGASPFAVQLAGLFSLAAAVGATISAIAFIESLDDYGGSSILANTTPPDSVKRIPFFLIWLCLNVCLVYAAGWLCWRVIARLRDLILSAFGRRPPGTV